MGVGIGNGKGKYFVPESNTDFVFPTWAEETGFVGSALLLLLEFTVGWRGFVISWRSPDPYSRLLAASFSAMFSLQALLNIAVVTGLWPVTGVPLPFISYGGTSILCSFLIIGLLLRIQRETALRVNR